MAKDTLGVDGKNWTGFDLDGTLADTSKAKRYIEEWCEKHFVFVPEVTHEKDALMERLYDDRVVQVIPDTGITIEEAARKVLWEKKSPEVKALLDYRVKALLDYRTE